MEQRSNIISISIFFFHISTRSHPLTLACSSQMIRSRWIRAEQPWVEVARSMVNGSIYLIWYLNKRSNLLQGQEGVGGRRPQNFCPFSSLSAQKLYIITTQIWGTVCPSPPHICADATYGIPLRRIASPPQSPMSQSPGCQIAIAIFLALMRLALRASGLWLRYSTN